MGGMTKQPTPTEYSAPALAQAADVDVRTIRRWIATGQLEARRATPRSPVRIPAAAAAELLQRLGRELPDKAKS